MRGPISSFLSLVPALRASCRYLSNLLPAVMILSFPINAVFGRSGCLNLATPDIWCKMRDKSAFQFQELSHHVPPASRRSSASSPVAPAPAPPTSPDSSPDEVRPTRGTPRPAPFFFPFPGRGPKSNSNNSPPFLGAAASLESDTLPALPLSAELEVKSLVPADFSSPSSSSCGPAPSSLLGRSPMGSSAAESAANSCRKRSKAEATPSNSF
mmetsp:Transcript_180312/g.572330  ORF Transcript_180312/g.572330 Transcript_180312/m.572330 type:complete len:212 (-) Transcript_180312:12-647(-)